MFEVICLIASMERQCDFTCFTVDVLFINRIGIGSPFLICTFIEHTDDIITTCYSILEEDISLACIKGNRRIFKHRLRCITCIIRSIHNQVITSTNQCKITLGILTIRHIDTVAFCRCICILDRLFFCCDSVVTIADFEVVRIGSLVQQINTSQFLGKGITLSSQKIIYFIVCRIVVFKIEADCLDR